MRTLSLVVVSLCVGASLAAAGQSPSPRIAALAADPKTEDAFWRQVAAEGTPLVEDVKDPKGRLLVTFLYRANATTTTKFVSIFPLPGYTSGRNGQCAKLERVPGTDVLAFSVLVDPTARFTYWLRLSDEFPPPKGEGFTPDLLNKRPVRFASMVELPKAPARGWLLPRRGTPTGEWTRYVAKTKAPDVERAVIVYTPPGFSKTGPQYPLVVMFDGPGMVPTLGLSILLDEMIAARKIPSAVLMLVDSVDRPVELAANAIFADYVALDLVPWVRRTYHATSDPRSTVIAGISIGGIAATFAAGRHPAVYGNVLSQSGSFWWSPEDAVEGEAIPHDFATRPRLPIRFWMECGAFEVIEGTKNTDQLGANRHMRDVLVARGYEVTYSEFVGWHDYLTWPTTLSDGLAALLATAPKPAGKPPASPGKAMGVELIAVPGRTIITTAVRTALLDGGAQAVAVLKKLGEDFATDGESVNHAADALLALDRPRDAIPLLKWNLERFPNSGNAHDRLAQAHYYVGDRVLALAEYQQAFKLDPKNDNAKSMAELLK